PVTWAGARYVERAVLIGTPNAGSAEALIQLVEGRRFAPILPRYQAAVLGTMPAIYRLLPRTRHVAVVEGPDAAPAGIFDPAAWGRFGWGLAASNHPRRPWPPPGRPPPAAPRRVGRRHLPK